MAWGRHHHCTIERQREAGGVKEIEEERESKVLLLSKLLSFTLKEREITLFERRSTILCPLFPTINTNRLVV